MLCNLCPNNCKTVRLCKKDGFLRVARIGQHFYEEPPVSGTLGSGTVFFCGCNMRCSFCQNKEISADYRGTAFTQDELISEIKRLESEGVHNINFVTPSHLIGELRALLLLYRPKTTVYNTSAYDGAEGLKGLDGLIDIYLPDYKYSDASLSLKLSQKRDYPSVALNAIAEMFKQQPKNVYSDTGLLKKGVIIRHLILPGYLENSVNALKILSDNFTGCEVSLLSQFTPRADCPELPRTLKPIEYKTVYLTAMKLNFSKIYTQELSSASPEFIPVWDL
ncbi:MAG: radical SAM protein [Christensenellaceae bacterium]|jgi:putative pyruvate formate lyase activating enzyme|nr:radical SAM protein [Christensenellaceae bacterium]